MWAILLYWKSMLITPQVSLISRAMKRMFSGIMYGVQELGVSDRYELVPVPTIPIGNRAQIRTSCKFQMVSQEFESIVSAKGRNRIAWRPPICNLEIRHKNGCHDCRWPLLRPHFESNRAVSWSLLNSVELAEFNQKCLNQGTAVCSVVMCSLSASLCTNPSSPIWISRKALKKPILFIFEEVSSFQKYFPFGCCPKSCHIYSLSLVRPGFENHGWSNQFLAAKKGHVTYG